MKMLIWAVHFRVILLLQSAGFNPLEFMTQASTAPCWPGSLCYLGSTSPHGHALFVCTLKCLFLLSLSFSFWFIPPFQEPPICLNYAFLLPSASTVSGGNWFISSKHMLLHKGQDHCCGWRARFHNRMQNWAESRLRSQRGSKKQPFEIPRLF